MLPFKIFISPIPLYKFNNEMNFVIELNFI